MPKKLKTRSLEDFQSYFTESIYRRINLLEKIIGDKHWLTTGTFKERLILEFLNKQMPRKLKAKSGFVIFPCERTFEKGIKPTNYDYLNVSNYDISKQLDIIIYDNSEDIAVYEDDSIIILPPEAIRSVFEVKGTLSSEHLKKSISQLNDFCRKWRRYQKFHEKHHPGGELTVPQLAVFSWEKSISRPLKEKTIRDNLVQNLKATTKFSEVDNIPIIDSVYVYNESITSLCWMMDDNVDSVGYLSYRAKNMQVTDDDIVIEKGDATLFDLLRNILTSNNMLKNRFVIDVNEYREAIDSSNDNFGYQSALERTLCLYSDGIHLTPCS